MHTRLAAAALVTTVALSAFPAWSQSLHDGTAGYLRVNGGGAVVPRFGLSAPETEVTVEYWQRVDGFANQAVVACETGSHNRFVIHTPWLNPDLVWIFGPQWNGGMLVYNLPQGVIGEWNHFAMVSSISGNYQRIYRNGVLEAESNYATPFQRADVAMFLGRGMWGDLAELRIWNRARTGSEIVADMGRRVDPMSAGLLAYYRFNEGAGFVARDATGNGLHGYFLGAEHFVPAVPSPGALALLGLGGVLAARHRR